MDKVTDFTEEQEITGGLLPAPAMEEGGSTHFFYVPQHPGDVDHVSATTRCQNGGNFENKVSPSREIWAVFL